MQQYAVAASTPENQEIDMLFVHADSFYHLTYSLFNVGTLYVATVCQQAGYVVRCMTTVDLFYLSEQQLELVIKTMKPKLIGFYALTDNLHSIERYAECFKKWHPQVITVLGGPLANIDPQALLENPSFDIAVRGEGEYIMRSLGDYFVRGQGQLADIQGIVYKQDGRTIVNPEAPVIANLDELPFPDHSLVSMTSGFHISTGRGCPYKCAFCFQKVHGGAFRYRSAKNVAEEIITRLEQYNSRCFFITDDVFAVNPRRVLEVCQRLVEYRQKTGRQFVFFCEGRAEVISRHPEIIDALIAAGLARLQIGVESGCQEALVAYGKKLTLADIENTVAACRGKALTVTGNIIIGAPHETEESIATTLEFAKKLMHLAPGVFECSTSHLTALAATPLAEHPEDFGITILDREFVKGLTLNDAYCQTEALSAARLRELGEYFEEQIVATMREIAKSLSFEEVLRHISWSRVFKLDSRYNMDHFSKCEVLNAYFTLFQGPRFRRLNEIPPQEFGQWIPMRTVEHRSYSPDSLSIRIPAPFGETDIIDDADELLAYELSASKLSAKQIAERIVLERHGELSSVEVIKRIMYPLYRRLEDRYQIVFYK